MSSNQPMRLPADIPFDGEEGLSPLNDPSVGDLAQSIIQQANESDTPAASIPTPPKPNVNAIHVTLPVGLVNPIDGREYREAEVRELNGSDEEYASRGKNYVERKGRMIERGVVSLGGDEVDSSVLQALAQGDREVLLMSISRATYGDEVKLDLTCPACNQEQTAIVNLSTDVEVRGYDDLRHEFAFSDGGSAVLHWATGADEATVWKFVEKNAQATTSELNTQMLGAVLEALDGIEIVDGVEAARQLGMKRRSELMDYIIENAPGPRYDLVTHTCSNCEHEAALEVAFGDLFR